MITLVEIHPPTTSSRRASRRRAEPRPLPQAAGATIYELVLVDDRSDASDVPPPPRAA